MDRKRYDIKVFGKEFTITSLENEEKVLKIAGYLDSRMREVSEGTGVVDFYNVLFLTSIVLVKDYLALLEKCEKKENLKYARKIKDLIQLVDGSLKRTDFL